MVTEHVDTGSPIPAPGGEPPRLRGLIVVTFGTGPADACELSRCPMHAHGPYGSREEAERIADAMPAWMLPHVLLLEGDDDPCLPAGRIWRSAGRTGGGGGDAGT